VTGLGPASGDTGVSSYANVVANFSEPTNARTANGTSVTIVRRGMTAAVRATVRYDASRRRVVLDPR
jgi:Bacterial Ig-like domain